MCVPLLTFANFHLDRRQEPIPLKSKTQHYREKHAFGKLIQGTASDKPSPSRQKQGKNGPTMDSTTNAGGP